MSEASTTINAPRADDYANAYPLITIDNHGDITLVVRKSEADNGKFTVRKKGFLVCSRTMARVSRPFEAMLFGQFKESKPADPTQPWVVLLHEDCPTAFQILLEIIHRRDDIDEDAIRQSELSVLVDLIIVADKYLVLPLLKPGIFFWFSEEDGQRYIRRTRLTKKDMVNLLYTARWLGYKALLWDVLTRFAYTCRLDVHQLIYDPEDDQKQDTQKPKLTALLSEDPQYLPQAYIDTICRLRIKFIDQALLWTAQVLGQASFHRSCPYQPDDCGPAQFNLMKQALQDHSLWPLPRKEDWRGTLESLLDGVDMARILASTQGTHWCIVAANPNKLAWKWVDNGWPLAEYLAAHYCRIEINRDLKQLVQRFDE